MSMIRQIWDRFCALRFLIVGIWDVAFSYAVFCALYYFFGGGWRDVVVVIVSTIVGITNAFVMHRFVTYRSKGIWWREYLRFYVVYGTQTALGAALFFILVTWLGYNAYITRITITLSFTVASYWAHKLYSFRPSRSN